MSQLLQFQALKALQPKSLKPTTPSLCHRFGYNPNLLLDAEEPEALDRLWVGDITYLRLRCKQFRNSAMLTDRYLRYIVNTVMESCFGTLETELEMTDHESIRETEMTI